MGDDVPVNLEAAGIDATRPIRIPTPGGSRLSQQAEAAPVKTEEKGTSAAPNTIRIPQAAWRFDIEGTNLKAVVAGKTSGGPKHVTSKGNQKTEDDILIDSSLKLLAVFDGVSNSQGPGGVSRNGGLAAVYAKQALAGEYKLDGKDIGNSIKGLQEKLLAEVNRDGSEVGNTTVTAASINGDKVTFANVGDSPAYFISGGKLEMAGVLDNSKKDASLLTQMLGRPSAPNIEVHTATRQVKAGDYIVLGTDGIEYLALTKHEADALELDVSKSYKVRYDPILKVNPEKVLGFSIEQVLEALAKENATPQDIVDIVMKSASGTDDRTVVVVKIDNK